METARSSVVCQSCSSRLRESHCGGCGKRLSSSQPQENNNVAYAFSKPWHFACLTALHPDEAARQSLHKDAAAANHDDSHSAPRKLSVRDILSTVEWGEYGHQWNSPYASTVVNEAIALQTADSFSSALERSDPPARRRKPRDAFQLQAAAALGSQRPAFASTTLEGFVYRLIALGLLNERPSTSRLRSASSGNNSTPVVLGRDLLDMCLWTRQAASRDEAFRICGALVSYGLLTHITGEEVGFSDSGTYIVTLNASKAAAKATVEAPALSGGIGREGSGDVSGPYQGSAPSTPPQGPVLAGKLRSRTGSSASVFAGIAGLLSPSSGSGNIASSVPPLAVSPHLGSGAPPLHPQLERTSSLLRLFGGGGSKQQASDRDVSGGGGAGAGQSGSSGTLHQPVAREGSDSSLRAFVRVTAAATGNGDVDGTGVGGGGVQTSRSTIAGLPLRRSFSALGVQHPNGAVEVPTNISDPASAAAGLERYRSPSISDRQQPAGAVTGVPRMPSFASARRGSAAAAGGADGDAGGGDVIGLVADAVVDEEDEEDEEEEDSARAGSSARTGLARRKASSNSDANASSGRQLRTPMRADGPTFSQLAPSSLASHASPATSASSNSTSDLVLATPPQSPRPGSALPADASSSSSPPIPPARKASTSANFSSSSLVKDNTATSSPGSLAPTSAAAGAGASAIAAAPSLPTGVIMQGWLVKRGHAFKNWRRRYFLLVGPQLSYYKVKNSAALSSTNVNASSSATPVGVPVWLTGLKPQRVIDLRHYTVEKAVMPRTPPLVWLRPKAPPSEGAAAASSSSSAASAGTVTAANKDSSVEYFMYAEARTGKSEYEAWLRALASTVHAYDAAEKAAKGAFVPQG